jgi:hypothetical protein
MVVRARASSLVVLIAAVIGVSAVVAFSGGASAAPPAHDDAPPVTADDYDHQWHSEDYTITLTAEDQGGSGINETYYVLDDGAVMAVSVDGQPMITTENASSSLEYWSVDNDGNEELPHNMLNGIKLDKTAPVARTGEDLELPEGSAWMLTGLYSTDNLGIASYEWSIVNGSGIDSLAGSTAWYVFFFPGEYPVTLTVEDNAGNYDVAEMLVVVYDSTYPELDIPGMMTVMLGEDASFSGWGCTDNVGIVSYYWDFGDGNESYGMNATHAYSEAGEYFVHLWVADEAGNEIMGSILVEVVESETTSTSSVMYLVGATVVALGVVLATVGYWRLRGRSG